MMDSHDYEEFRRKLLEQYGIEVGESRGKISYLVPDCSKPIRGNKLGTDFEKDFIESYFRLNRSRFQQDERKQKLDDPHRIPRRESSRQQHSRPEPYIRLIVDIQTCIKAQENKYYA